MQAFQTRIVVMMQGLEGGEMLIRRAKLCARLTAHIDPAARPLTETHSNNCTTASTLHSNYSGSEWWSMHCSVQQLDIAMS